MRHRVELIRDLFLAAGQAKLNARWPRLAPPHRCSGSAVVLRPARGARPGSIPGAAARCPPWRPDADTMLAEVDGCR